VVDRTAGVDSFASGLFTRFDLTILVVEPTREGIPRSRAAWSLQGSVTGPGWSTPTA